MRVMIIYVLYFNTYFVFVGRFSTRHIQLGPNEVLHLSLCIYGYQVTQTDKSITSDLSIFQAVKTLVADFLCHFFNGWAFTGSFGRFRFVLNGRASFSGFLCTRCLACNVVQQSFLPSFRCKRFQIESNEKLKTRFFWRIGNIYVPFKVLNILTV